MRRSLSVDLIQTLFVACLVVTGLAIAPDAQEPGNPYTTLVDVRMGQRFFPRAMWTLPWPRRERKRRNGRARPDDRKVPTRR